MTFERITDAERALIRTARDTLSRCYDEGV